MPVGGHARPRGTAADRAFVAALVALAAAAAASLLLASTFP